MKNTIGTHISVKEIGGTTESVEGGRLWGGKNVSEVEFFKIWLIRENCLPVPLLRETLINTIAISRYPTLAFALKDLCLQAEDILLNFLSVGQ